MAAIQLILENIQSIQKTRFGETDYCKKGHLILFRTESDFVLKGEEDSLPEVGDVCTHLRGAHESHSIYKVVSAKGAEGTIGYVPFSRISALYFMESTPGSNKPSFENWEENEVSADTRGIEMKYAGHVDGGELVSEFYDCLVKREN